MTAAAAAAIKPSSDGGDESPATATGDDSSSWQAIKSRTLMQQERTYSASQPRLTPYQITAA